MRDCHCVPSSVEIYRIPALLTVMFRVRVRVSDRVRVGVRVRVRFRVRIRASDRLGLG
jgi:hypothetical protein